MRSAFTAFLFTPLTEDPLHVPNAAVLIVNAKRSFLVIRLHSMFRGRVGMAKVQLETLVRAEGLEPSWAV
jgi:hypothetical protein